MKSSVPLLSNTSRVHGLIFLLPAFCIWGTSPVYWKLLEKVSSLELLFHRVVWSFCLLILLVVLTGRGTELFQVLRNKGAMLTLAGTTILLAFNWYLFIYAVNSGQVLQTSLGYYINPLINVFLGLIVLKESLRRLQVAALILAGVSVLYYALGLGEFPWISLALAFSFGFYGLFHKLTPVTSLIGLCVETSFLLVPAAGYLAWLFYCGRGAWLSMGIGTDLLLVGTNLVTALPLLLFTLGAKRVSLSTVGFMQYIAPSLSFLLAVFLFEEPFSRERLITFIIIWIALGLYSADSLYYYKKHSQATGTKAR